MQVAKGLPPNDDLVDCISHSKPQSSHLQSGKNNLCLAEGVSIKELWKLCEVLCTCQDSNGLESPGRFQENRNNGKKMWEFGAIAWLCHFGEIIAPSAGSGVSPTMGECHSSAYLSPQSEKHPQFISSMFPVITDRDDTVHRGLGSTWENQATTLSW